MDSQVQNEPSMSYSHMPLPDRRDSNLDSSVATPFQSHQSLGQALGPHLSSTVGPRQPFQDSYRLSPSPPILSQNNQSHAGPSNSPLTFSVPPPGDRLQTSPGTKRKPIDGIMNGHMPKRRRDGDEIVDSFESDNAQGAKHWTDDEKSKLFNWLMGPGQDDHWNALRATKNSCLRECAVEVFGSKKTYQALKGCYERNFNLFKQIYSLESYHAHLNSGPMPALSEADRLREYERRLQVARKAGCDVGNITARAIDHWHRAGWYDLFYRRWHGDPATTRPMATRSSGVGASAAEDLDGDDDRDPTIDFTEPSAIHRPNDISLINSLVPENSHSVHPLNFKDNIPAIPNSPIISAGSIPSQTRPSDPTTINVTFTQTMMTSYLQFLQAQSQTSKLKLEYMRRREEREEKDSNQRNELERLRLERESAQWEHTKQSANVKQKADRAIELLANPSVDTSVKQAAGDYLKKLFAAD